MHRSGTSAVAGILHLNGIAMGSEKTFKPKPLPQNPKGFYENYDFRKINDQILKQAGYKVKSFDTDIPVVHASDRTVAKMGKLTEKQVSENTDWGWKAPRTCLPLSEWLSSKKHLLISIAAGISISSLESWAGDDLAIVRAMPNTPALINTGITALFANSRVSLEQRNQAESIMCAVGKVVWIKEETLMDTVTAVSGSGPAYFFYFMEALEQAAIEEGLDKNTARLLTLETALGAARLAIETTKSPSELRDQVTSPGGTTEAAIQVLEQVGMSQILKTAVTAARKRSADLANSSGID